MKFLVAPLALFALVLASCQPPPDSLAEPKAGRSSEQLGLMRAVSWPGGGSELTISVRGLAGEALIADLSSSFQLALGDGSEVAFQARPLSLAPGYTGLLIDMPRTESDRAQLLGQLKAFVDGRPAEESIGLFLIRDSVMQLAGFTSDRARLHRALDRLPSIANVTSPIAIDAAIPAVVADTLAVGGTGPSLMRAVVVAGTIADSAPSSAIPVVMGLDGAGDRLDRFAQSSIYQVAMCGPTHEAEATLSSTALEGTLRVPLPKTPAEELQRPCDIAAISAGVREYPDRLELFFSPAQRAIYDARVAALSDEDFELSLGFGPDRGVVSATAHLRGKGTLGCERKSYTLEIAGPGRHLFAGSRTDEYYLLSMCADDRYVQQYTANQLMQELGLFPLRFRYVELSLDGEQQGVYLLLEKTREELVRDNSRVLSVMRRRFDVPDDLFEIKYDAGDPSPASSYQRAIENAGTRADYMDIEQYLRFLALMSALENGDYIDEIWVSGTETIDRDGVARSYFSMMAWDNDDLFSECHYASRHAFEDPFALAYCAEASVDFLLLEDPQTYARFVDILERLLLQELTPERFDQAILATDLAIMPFLARPGLSAAMVRLIEDNPAAVDPQEAQRDVREKLDSLAANYRLRRQLLLDRIQIYREAQ